MTLLYFFDFKWDFSFCQLKIILTHVITNFKNLYKKIFTKNFEKIYTKNFEKNIYTKNFEKNIYTKNFEKYILKILKKYTKNF